MKRLPIGIQNFKEISTGGYLYVDKTEYVYKLINDTKYNFLSRPRRFGKSLLLDTIAEVFSGEKELFKGLWIYGSDYDFKKHPVIRLDMSNVSTKDPDILEESILSSIKRQISAEEISIDTEIPSDMFKCLIMELHDKYNERVVVLIDEYDKPILDHITNLEMAEANRQVIKNFYGILKSMDPHLHFVMMTGVSKFTKTSVFSELNNMVDITMMDRYANICGITVEDFDEHFAEHISSIASARKLKHIGDLRSEILRWYDGYSWDGETRVLNPFSLLSFFGRQYFGNFWYDSGTPGFLVKLIKRRPEAYANIEGVEIIESALNSGDLDRISPVALMFQSGYLTVKDVTYEAPPVYTLEMPNCEVKDSFNLHVVSQLVENDEAGTRSLSVELRKALRGGDMQTALGALRRLFSSIPYELHVSKEAYYHSVIYALMKFVGLDINAEVSVSGGRVDAILEYNDKVFVMEFKYKDCDPGADAEAKGKLIDTALTEAMEQIEDKGYCNKYTGSGKTIYKAAFAFVGRDYIEMRYDTQNTGA